MAHLFPRLFLLEQQVSLANANALVEARSTAVNAALIRRVRLQT